MDSIQEVQQPGKHDPARRQIDLARWLGRREAFGAIAGRCSAADIACLREIREEKLYLDKARTWDEFCRLHLGTSRRKVDQDIKHLDEFGQEFFLLGQLTKITPEAYRLIAPHVTEEGIRLNGELIELRPDNSERVAAAVAELRQRLLPSAESDAPSFDKLLKRSENTAALLERANNDLTRRQKADLGKVLQRVIKAAAALGIQWIGP